MLEIRALPSGRSMNTAMKSAAADSIVVGFVPSTCICEFGARALSSHGFGAKKKNGPFYRLGATTVA